MGAAVKESDDDDDITPAMAQFRSSTLPLDFTPNGSSSSSKSRPNTVSTSVSSNKRNGKGVDLDIDDSMSCGSSPGLHFNSRFVAATSLHPPSTHSVSASGIRKASSYNGQSGKLSLNTNIFHENGTGNSTRGETKDAGYAYNSTSSSKRQSITESILSPNVGTNNTTLKKEVSFGDPTHPTTSTPSSRGRSSTVIGHSRFRFPT